MVGFCFRKDKTSMKTMSEDQVRDQAGKILGLNNNIADAVSGVGQLTTFNQLGFKGIYDKPDGWYLPNNINDVALVLETKAGNKSLEQQKEKDELLKNIRIVKKRYERVVGILYNGKETRVFKNEDEIKCPESLQNLNYYMSLFSSTGIDKEQIYQLTAKINNDLNFEFGINNLYQRMIFTACALVAERYGANLKSLKNQGYDTLKAKIESILKSSLEKDKQQNTKIEILIEEYGAIKINITENQEAIDEFIDCVVEISKSINSNEWRGEDVMGIFFNEFNRYKKKSERGQIFTPEHITDFMYKILEVSKKDYILDATCGSGGFLVKAMANMIQEAGGMETNEAKDIKSNHLFGIEMDRVIYALACANMLIHKDGKTNLDQNDARSESACSWIKSKTKISKVMMNPPYENKYGCMIIVENVLNNVPPHTLCGFILPDKKLEKTSPAKIKDMLRNNRLLKIIKLPENLFFGVGITTSIFIFETGIPQGGKDIFACYMESDGLETVKNEGRHDVHNKWGNIEKHWVDVVEKLQGDPTCQWLNPSEHLSYQVPQKPFEIFEEDFRKTAMDYLMFQKKINAKDFENKLINSVMFSSKVEKEKDKVKIILKTEEGEDDGN